MNINELFIFRIFFLSLRIIINFIFRNYSILLDVGGSRIDIKQFSDMNCNPISNEWLNYVNFFYIFYEIYKIQF